MGLVNNNILTDFYGKLRDTHNFISCRVITKLFYYELFHLKQVTPLTPTPPHPYLLVLMT